MQSDPERLRNSPPWVSELRDKPDSTPGFTPAGATDHYLIGSFSAGLAYLLTDRASGCEQLLTGEAAYLFNAELQFLLRAKNIAGSPIATKPWAESLDHLVKGFWQPASPARNVPPDTN